MSDHLCPEDGEALIPVPLETAQRAVHECPDCHGVWVDRELIERLEESVESGPPPPSAVGLPISVRGMDPPAPRSFRPCPVCGAMMDWKACGGVVVDVCGEHGVWFDDGELGPFVVWVQAGQPRSGTLHETLPLAAFLGLAAPLSESGEGSMEKREEPLAMRLATGAMEVLVSAVEILAK